MTKKQSHFSQMRVFTYKKDRTVAVYRTAQTITLVEAGYLTRHQRYALQRWVAARRQLKRIFKQEFPHSRYVYVVLT